MSVMNSCRPQMIYYFFFFLMIRRPPRSTQRRSSAASDVYKRQVFTYRPASLYLGIGIALFGAALLVGSLLAAAWQRS